MCVVIARAGTRHVATTVICGERGRKLTRGAWAVAEDEGGGGGATTAFSPRTGGGSGGKLTTTASVVVVLLLACLSQAGLANFKAGDVNGAALGDAKRFGVAGVAGGVPTLRGRGHTARRPPPQCDPAIAAAVASAVVAPTPTAATPRGNLQVQGTKGRAHPNGQRRWRRVDFDHKRELLRKVFVDAGEWLRPLEWLRVGHPKLPRALALFWDAPVVVWGVV